MLVSSKMMMYNEPYYAPPRDYRKECHGHGRPFFAYFGPHSDEKTSATTRALFFGILF